MIDIHNPPPSEKIILAGILTPEMNKDLFDEDIHEMEMLCTTAGAEVVEVVIQKMNNLKASTYIGEGKLEQISNTMKLKGCETLIVDAELAPSQIRNIEKCINGKVIDRSQLILDIFAQHARTNEAKIQVELAQLRTLYPRLTHAWSHFSQQVGGIGTRGPGEKQLEIDRRLVQKKISDLKQKLEKIELSRSTQRKKRSDTIKLTLVGYTNVGKSTILNSLSGSKVKVENKLFATLDTSTRRTYIPGTGEVVISDTVGFLRKLPHHLVASFKSTLEVALEADILLIIMDASSQWIDQQFNTVYDVLNDLGSGHKHLLIIFNKADCLNDPFTAKKISIAYPDSILISAYNENDIKLLKERINFFINRRKNMFFSLYFFHDSIIGFQ